MDLRSFGSIPSKLFQLNFRLLETSVQKMIHEEGYFRSMILVMALICAEGVNAKPF
jgi:hypothetical protein